MEEYSKIVDMIMNGGVFYGGGYEHDWRSVLGWWI